MILFYCVEQYLLIFQYIAIDQSHESISPLRPYQLSLRQVVLQPLNYDLSAHDCCFHHPEVSLIRTYSPYLHGSGMPFCPP